MLRVVYCEEQAWVLSRDCSHWTETCPRAKKAKKSAHKFRRSDHRGYDLAVTGIAPDGWLYDYEPDECALELSVKHYDGHWCPGPEFKMHERCGLRPGDSDYDGVTQGSVFVPGPQSLLVECVVCGMKGSL